MYASDRPTGFGPGWFRDVGLPALFRLDPGDAQGDLDHGVPRLVRALIDRSLHESASDIHIEPGPEDLAVRIRLDGTLVSEQTLPLDLHPKIATHLKATAGLDITERRRPLDGRLTWEADGRQVDIRISTVPGAHGEKIVLRLLDPDRLPSDFSGLGMDARTERALTAAVQRARGLILFTGPTGSGKSTSLYTLLRSADRATRNVMTVEDPVEYHLEGVTQVSVDTKTGRTFASVLRSFLRQDPDVLLVGEIRDTETAQICIRASLTGHLVLSTLHTNDAAGAVVRLADMGIEPFLLASSLSLVVSQRLLRRLCPHCRRPAYPDGAFLDRYRLALPEGVVPQASDGCEACRGTGAAGRVGIFETLVVSPRLQTAVRSGAGASELADLAAGEGLITLQRQGLSWVERGEVSAREFTTQVLAAATLGDLT